MFHMSRKDEPFAEMVRALHFIPVSISYEYDPCDLAKARELHTRASTGEYRKAPGEDDASIALGITGYKGRVHINFGAELEGEFSDAKQLAAELVSIAGNYKVAEDLRRSPQWGKAVHVSLSGDVLNITRL